MSKKLTTEEFIEKSNMVHNNKFDYSLSEYVTQKIKVKIICPIHGVFEQEPNAHLNGQGCPQCNKHKRNGLVGFIEKSNKIHKNKYDYSLVEYVDSNVKVKIICFEHGIFEQKPCNHINSKHGCSMCGGTKKLTTEKFIEKSNDVHNNKYDYSLVNYKNNTTKVKIKCPIHGIFEKSANSHLKGSGCIECSKEKSRKSQEFIIKSKDIHKNKYDYSLVDYKHNRKNVKIICPEHGMFEQKPNLHLKRGCPICEGNMKLTTEQIIFIFNNIHNYKYDYSLVNYKNDKIKVKIICPKHGIFEQRPNQHKIGGGCPKCNESKGEKEISKILESHKIEFVYNKRFKNCKYEKTLPFDFYLPKQNICIEFDGIQHFNRNTFFGGEKRLIQQQKTDIIKNIFCQENNIKLIRIKYDENIYDKLSFLF